MHEHGYLTMTRIAGDPERLLEGYRSSAEVMDGVGRDHGLILHCGAATEDGLLIVNVWPSRDGSESAARDPRRLGQLAANDLDPGRISREHRGLERLVVFERGVAQPVSAPNVPRGVA